ncbi:MAG TPA: hypothetical protein VLA72_22395, partial [Anaerolineales bacterium]|nr:hypothetical protein [Anaerolineales bacterium]
ILKYIKRMKNRRFETENEFLDELRASFKDDELTRQYETIFLQCALKHAEVPIYLEKETFLNAPFEKRLAFLVKQRIGVSKIQWIAQRISPYLRQKGIENAALAENHIAMHIMFRNLWFGFLIISIILAIGAFQNANRLGSYIIFSSTFFIASIISFKRALLFYSWHSREILFGFYHLAIDNQISNQPTSNNDNLPDHLSRV